jgi:hypothetical protein
MIFQPAAAGYFDHIALPLLPSRKPTDAWLSFARLSRKVFGVNFGSGTVTS